MKKFMLYLTNPQDKLLRAHSGKTGICKSEIIRRALDEYFYKQRRRTRLDDGSEFEEDSIALQLDAEDGNGVD